MHYRWPGMDRAGIQRAAHAKTTAGQSQQHALLKGRYDKAADAVSKQRALISFDAPPTIRQRAKWQIQADR